MIDHGCDCRFIIFVVAGTQSVLQERLEIHFVALDADAALGKEGIIFLQSPFGDNQNFFVFAEFEGCKESGNTGSDDKEIIGAHGSSPRPISSSVPAVAVLWHAMIHPFPLQVRKSPERR
ncbi:hypothetical protein SDC9_102823 [bioreactor metagenome]|uniref:Uncharacterized protein n=1 Tax=bioreactor metagenome TaxID=1076179 RepID=A0A645ARX0_9ZZZZ